MCKRTVVVAVATCCMLSCLHIVAGTLNENATEMCVTKVCNLS